MSYSLLIGKVEAYALDNHGTRHVELLVRARGRPFRASLNIWSKAPPHRLRYGFRRDLHHPLLRLLSQRREGLYDLTRPSLHALRLDYRKQGLIRRSAMTVLTDNKRGPRNDLLDMVLPRMRQVMGQPEAFKVVLFGDRWGPEDRDDWYFNHDPSQGVHNIHMNGGEMPDRHYEDGALLILDRHAKRWEGHFFAFQSAKF